MEGPVVASQVLAKTGSRLYLIVAQIAASFCSRAEDDVEPAGGGGISLRAARGQLSVIDRLCVFLWTMLVIRF